MCVCVCVCVSVERGNTNLATYFILREKSKVPQSCCAGFVGDVNGSILLRDGENQNLRGNMKIPRDILTPGGRLKEHIRVSMEHLIGGDGPCRHASPSGGTSHNVVEI